MLSALSRATLAGAALLVIAFPHPAEAQFGGLARKVKERVQAPGRPAGQAESPAGTPAAAAATLAGNREVWANYDFIPGQRTLFYSDFTDDGVGDLPRRLEFKGGAMEIVELDGQRALKASAASGFVVPLPEVLPQRFTLEIDVINRNSMSVAQPTIKVYGGTAVKTDVDRERTRVTFGHTGWEVGGGGTESQANFTSEEAEGYLGRPVSVRVLGDGAYLKLYADGRRLANVPNAAFMRGRGIFVAVEARDGEANAVYITRIRIAESDISVYDALAATGRWATQGILFASGKATIRPESAPALKAIAAALTGHPDLRIRIEGHTDNVGSAEANLRLSEERAAAIRAALVSEHGIAPERLEISGLGDTKPAADNGTPEGRSSNRRVEVVKL